MICIRNDIIEKELEKGLNGEFTKLKISNRFIDWLFRHYYTFEFTERYRDIDLYFSGNWGMSQCYVDNISHTCLTYTKKGNISYKDRMYYCAKDDAIYIYYYGRDYMYKDYWWVFKKKKSKR